MRDPDAPRTGSALGRHLARGAIGFGLIGSALVLAGSIGVAALALVPLGMVALRGCPACWIAATVELLATGGPRRDCASCAPSERDAGRRGVSLELGAGAVRHTRRRN
jgi:hypothetical protein